MSMSNQTSSVLLTSTTKWGSRLQQLGIHIWEIVVPLIMIDGMRPCLPNADDLSDISFCPIRVLGWQLNSVPIYTRIRTGWLRDCVSFQRYSSANRSCQRASLYSPDTKHCTLCFCTVFSSLRYTFHSYFDGFYFSYFYPRSRRLTPL